MQSSGRQVPSSVFGDAFAEKSVSTSLPFVIALIASPRERTEKTNNYAYSRAWKISYSTRRISPNN